MAQTLLDIGYTSTHGDPDVWIQPANKQDGFEYYVVYVDNMDGFEYYEMMLVQSSLLVYVDNIICVSHDPDATMKAIQNNFNFKDDKIEPPSDYLGSHLQYQNIDDQMYWKISSHKYLDAAIANVEEQLKFTSQCLLTKCHTLLTTSYRPELDISIELDQEQT